METIVKKSIIHFIKEYLPRNMDRIHIANLRKSKF